MQTESDSDLQKSEYKSIQIFTNGKIQDYVNESLKHLTRTNTETDSDKIENKNYCCIHLYPSSIASIHKLVSVAEIVKRSYLGSLYQHNLFACSDTTNYLPTTTTTTTTTKESQPPKVEQTEIEQTAHARNDQIFKAVVLNNSKRPKNKHNPYLSILLTPSKSCDPQNIISLDPCKNEIKSITLQEHNSKVAAKRRSRKRGNKPSKKPKMESPNNNEIKSSTSKLALLANTPTSKPTLIKPQNQCPKARSIVQDASVVDSMSSEEDDGTGS